MAYSPVADDRDFHYGLGVWLECSSDEACLNVTVVSTTGGTGPHGWVDYANNIYGTIALDGGGLGTGNDVLNFAIDELRPAFLKDLVADEDESLVVSEEDDSDEEQRGGGSDDTSQAMSIFMPSILLAGAATSLITTIHSWT